MTDAVDQIRLRRLKITVNWRQRWVRYRYGDFEIVYQCGDEHFLLFAWLCLRALPTFLKIARYSPERRAQFITKLRWLAADTKYESGSCPMCGGGIKQIEGKSGVLGHAHRCLKCGYEFYPEPN